MQIGPKSSAKLHYILLRTVMRFVYLGNWQLAWECVANNLSVPLKVFLQKPTPGLLSIGAESLPCYYRRWLTSSRFSQDMTLIDISLPIALLVTGSRKCQTVVPGIMNES